MVAPQISPLPTPPARNDPANFAARGDAFLLALPQFRSEANAVSSFVDTRIQEAFDAGLANAASNASSAAASASAASGSASAASSSAASAAASYDQFDDRYLGPKSANPILDNDGNTLLVGAMYFNTAAMETRVWNGTAWQSASVVGGTVNSLNVTGALSYQGTLTGGTGVVNLGGGQLVKDIAGNLGLGIAPSPFISPTIQIGGFGSVFGDGNTLALGHGYTTSPFNGSSIHATTGERPLTLRIDKSDGAFKFFVAPAGTAGQPVSFFEAVRFTADLKVGISQPNPNAKLDILQGEIRAGTQESTGGSTILSGQYSGNETINIFGARRSSGGTVIGYSAEPRPDDAGYRSTQGQFVAAPKVIEMDSDGFKFLSAPNALTSRNVALTMNELGRMSNNGNLLLATTNQLGALGGSIRLGDVTAIDQDTNSTYIAAGSSGAEVSTRLKTGNLPVQISLNSASGAIIFRRSLAGAAGEVFAFAESGRFTSGGYFKVSPTGQYVDGSNSNRIATDNHLFISNAGDATVIASNLIENVSQAATYGSIVKAAFTGTHFIAFTGGSLAYQVLANGSVQNATNSYGAISDPKLKNILGSKGSTWQKTKAYNWIEYYLKSDTEQNTKMLGLNAADALEVSPGVVDFSDDMREEIYTETFTKMVPVTQTVVKESTTTSIELVDGQYRQVLSTKPVEVEEPVLDEFPLFDESGEPVLEEVSPYKAAVLDENGEVIEPEQPPEYRQKMHLVQRMEEVTEQVEKRRMVPTGEQTMSVKYSVIGMQYFRTVQECQSRIEGLETFSLQSSEVIDQLMARVASLEAASN